MPSSFTLHEVSGGVWMAEAHGTASAAVSNAALVDLGDRTLVVDTFMTALAAEELMGESLRLTGRRPFLVVNSHWHSDHVGGNNVFGDAAIVGTTRMKELIAEDAPKSRAVFEESARTIREAADKMTATAESDEERTNASGMAALADALLSDEDGHRIALPNVLIGDRLDIEGGRRATILGYGRGHTESDLFVHLPDDEVLIAGDIVWTGVHPKTSDGFPAEWAALLERVADLGADHVVSGHGPPGTAADVKAMAHYLIGLDAMIEMVRAGELDPQRAPVPSGSKEWRDPGRYRAGLTSLAAR